MTTITTKTDDDPFLLAQSVAAGAIDPRIGHHQATEIRRLVACEDLFGAGLVAASAIGRPLKAFGAPPVIGGKDA
jgi:hypothetical protein